MSEIFTKELDQIQDHIERLRKSNITESKMDLYLAYNPTAIECLTERILVDRMVGVSEYFQKAGDSPETEFCTLYERMLKQESSRLKVLPSNLEIHPFQDFSLRARKEILNILTLELEETIEELESFLNEI